MADSIVPRTKYRNPILWKRAVTILMNYRMENLTCLEWLGEHAYIGVDWPESLMLEEIAELRYPRNKDAASQFYKIIHSECINGQIRVIDTKRLISGDCQVRVYFIRAADFLEWTKIFFSVEGYELDPGEILQDWFDAWIDPGEHKDSLQAEETAKEIDKEDAKLGRKVRAQRSEIGKRRHAENQARIDYWRPFVEEARKLIRDKPGLSNIGAARIVSKRHPKEGIKEGSLRGLIPLKNRLGI